MEIVNRHEIAVIHGRFQPLHVGHMEYLIAGKARSETLVVGITNPDPNQFGNESTDPDRGKLEANPFTFYERYLMVEGALREEGIDNESFRIVPFPHSYPERLRFYAPPEAVYLLSIYNEWGETKLRRFTELGLKTEVLWRRTSTVTSGTEIRHSITNNEPWEHLVPNATARVVKERCLHRFGGSGQHPDRS